MRTARFTRLGIGTVVALATLGAIGGCGLGGGITVVGANPGGGGRSAGGAEATVSAANVEAHGTGRSASGQFTTAADGVTPASTASPSSLPSHANDACTDGALRLQVEGDAEHGVGSSASKPMDKNSTNAAVSSATPRVVGKNNTGSKPPRAANSPDVDQAGAQGLGSATKVQQLTLVVTNASHSTCTLRGYPSVDFLRAGVRGPLTAPNSFTPDPKGAVVRLAPGEAASSLIAFTTNGPGNPHGARCEQVVSVRVYAPGSTTALTAAVRDSTGHRIASFYVCGHGVVVHALQRRK